VNGKRSWINRIDCKLWLHWYFRIECHDGVTR
jgi:hypothetical protein